MPVEIRELVIKTEVRSQTHQTMSNASIHTEDILEMKKEIMAACKRMILEQKKRTYNKR